MELLAYEVIKLYGHMALNTELQNLVRDPFSARPIRTFPNSPQLMHDVPLFFL